MTMSVKMVCLIDCHAGVSRSVTITWHILIKSQNMTFEQAFVFGKSKRRAVNPNGAFKQQLRLSYFNFVLRTCKIVTIVN